jgi:hypothetical protein
MNEQNMLDIVEQYNRNNDTLFEGIKIVRVPDYKTVFVEQIAEVGRSVVLTEYKVNGKKYWAGYSSRSQTVYISRAA